MVSLTRSWPSYGGAGTKSCERQRTAAATRGSGSTRRRTCCTAARRRGKMVVPWGTDRLAVALGAARERALARGVLCQHPSNSPPARPPSHRRPAPPAEPTKKPPKALKKPLKLARLDDESRIAGGPMSKGQASGIFAITPPNQFSQAVWDELVRRGKLKHTGHGMYEL